MTLLPQDMGDRSSCCHVLDGGRDALEGAVHRGHSRRIRHQAPSPGANFAALCREYGVSRKTGYKWLERYDEAGVRGLEDLSRRPRETPLEVSGDVVALIVELRVAHPTWGSKKLEVLAARRLPKDQVPSRSTIDRILKRSGLVQPGRRRRRTTPAIATKPDVVALAPNDVWTVDFKGWWLTMDKTRCEPLTIRDAFSRYVLQIEVLSTTSIEAGRPVFEDVFARYGLPKAILTRQRHALRLQLLNARVDEALDVVAQSRHRARSNTTGHAVRQWRPRTHAPRHGCRARAIQGVRPPPPARAL